MTDYPHQGLQAKFQPDLTEKYASEKVFSEVQRNMPIDQKTAATRFGADDNAHDAWNETRTLAFHRTTFSAGSRRASGADGQPQPGGDNAAALESNRSHVTATETTLGTARVAKQVLLGAMHQIYEHPIETAKDVAIGSAVAGVAMVADMGTTVAAAAAALPASTYVAYNEIKAGVSEGINSYQRRGDLPLAIRHGFIASGDYMDGLAAAAKAKGQSLLSAASAVFWSEPSDQKLASSEATLRDFGAGAVPVAAALIGGTSSLSVDGVRMASKVGSTVGNEIRNLRVPGMPPLEPAYARVGKLTNRLPEEVDSRSFDARIGLSGAVQVPPLVHMMSQSDSDPAMHNLNLGGSKITEEKTSGANRKAPQNPHWLEEMVDESEGAHWLNKISPVPRSERPDVDNWLEEIGGSHWLDNVTVQLEKKR